jgi:predicted nucleic acid-binding Zn ribbon protein
MSHARRPQDEDEWSDDSEWADDPADSVETPCPACGKPVYEDTDKCPHCGEWISPLGEAERRSRTWFWPVIVTLLIILVLVAWHGLGR